MTAQTIKLLVFVNGEPEGFLSDADYLTKYHPELTPGSTPVIPKPDVVTGPPAVEERPLFAAPRTVIGYTSEGAAIATGTGIDYLLEIFSKAGEPDQFSPRGFNRAYTPVAGVTRPTGPETPWGVGVPSSFTRPQNYRKRYFPRDGAVFWEQSALADEADPDAENAKPATRPITPTILAHYELSDGQK